MERFVLGAMIAAVVGFCGFVIWDDTTRKTSFIAECRADGKKPYECEALWRAGNPSFIFIR